MSFSSKLSADKKIVSAYIKADQIRCQNRCQINKEQNKSRNTSKNETGLSIEVSILRPVLVRDKGLEPLRSPART